jgi:hypothetical protein
MPLARWARDGVQQINIFGRLKEGTISQGDHIQLPCADGRQVVGTVGMFMETLQGWTGLPFYQRLNAEPTPFCIAIFLPDGEYDIRCPSTALPAGRS